MKKIFALQGVGNSGKSTTLRIFAEMLLDKGFISLTGKNFPEIKLGRTGKPKDFWQIFEVNGLRIGVTSSGDTFDIVRWQIDNLVKFKCEICFCACRTSGATVDAVEETVGYFKDYPPKKGNKNELTQKSTDEKHALELLGLLESHLSNER
jgi:hypothetical protein